MIALLLRLYPARWRARYGDEFAAVLEERPLGPFDVADVLLGALDAHLHLRGLGAASQHAKGFAMSLRIGGYAAIAGGALWFLALAASAATQELSGVWSVVLLAATGLLLVALVGLSAFQARSHPRLTWAAFAIPAVGAVVSLVGMAGMAINGDGRFIGGWSAWYVWAIGTVTLLVGSVLFALATWRAHALSRAAAGLLAVGSLVIFPLVAGVTGSIVPEPLGVVVSAVCLGAFSAGWVALGVSALRVRPASITIEGASL
jgi:hypothetical protein